MATVKYFNGTSEIPCIWMMKNAEFALNFPGVKGLRADSFSKLVGKIDGQLVPATRRIDYKSRPSLHKCNDKCVNSKGHICECSCGGANHGAGYSCAPVAN